MEMKIFFHLRILFLYLILGDYVHYSTAGLLDILGEDNSNINPLGNLRNQQPNINLFPIISPNNNNGGNRPNNNINDPRNSGAYQDYDNTNYRRPVNNGFNRPNNVNQGNSQNSKEKLENLLERLKELNRLKEQRQKEEEEKGKQNGDFNPNESGNSQTGNDDKPRPGYDNNNLRPGFNGNDNTGKKNGRWKQMMKRKIVFQAQPVIPENEIVRNDNTVYYLEDAF